MVENSFYSQKSSNFAPLFAKSLVSFILSHLTSTLSIQFLTPRNKDSH